MKRKEEGMQDCHHFSLISSNISPWQTCGKYAGFTSFLCRMDSLDSGEEEVGLDRDYPGILRGFERISILTKIVR